MASLSERAAEWMPLGGKKVQDCVSFSLGSLSIQLLQQLLCLCMVVTLWQIQLVSSAVPDFYVAALFIMYALWPSAIYDDLKPGSTKEGQRPSDAGSSIFFFFFLSTALISSCFSLLGISNSKDHWLTVDCIQLSKPNLVHISLWLDKHGTVPIHPPATTPLVQMLMKVKTACWYESINQAVAVTFINIMCQQSCLVVSAALYSNSSKLSHISGCQGVNCLFFEEKILCLWGSVLNCGWNSI